MPISAHSPSSNKRNELALLVLWIGIRFLSVKLWFIGKWSFSYSFNADSHNISTWHLTQSFADVLANAYGFLALAKKSSTFLKNLQSPNVHMCFYWIYNLIFLQVRTAFKFFWFWTYFLIVQYKFHLLWGFHCFIRQYTSLMMTLWD